MVKDHSDREIENLLPPHGLFFPISNKDNTYHELCYTSRGALAGMRNTYNKHRHIASYNFNIYIYIYRLSKSYNNSRYHSYTEE